MPMEPSTGDGTAARAGVRIAVTVGVLAIYFLGGRVPLPGLDLVAVEASSRPFWGGAGERFGVLSLGVMPWLNALILGEVLWLLFDGVRRWRATHDRQYQRVLLIVTILFAAMQAYGVAIALDQVQGLVLEPGDGFIWPAALTLFAGSTVAIGLATVISREGIGSGFWVIFLAPLLFNVPGTIGAVWAGLGRGEYTAATVLVVPLLAIAAAGLVAAVLRQRTEAGLVDQSGVVWPPLLGAVLAGWLFAVVSMRFVSDDGSSSIVQPGHFLYDGLLAGLIVLVCWRYAHIAGFGPLGLKTGVVVAGVAVLPDLILASLGLPPLLNGSAIIIAVTVLFSFAQVWQTAEAPGSVPGARGGPDIQSL